MIYNTHNPEAGNGKDWDKKYKHLEIYSNHVNPFHNTPPGIGSGWDIARQNNNYYWNLSICHCTCPYSKRGSCSEHNTDWKETSGEKLIYYEGVNGSITLYPLKLWHSGTGFFKPISAKWKEKTGTFKIKTEPIHLTDDCDKINQIEFMVYFDKFQKTISDIIEKGSYISLWFKRDEKGGYGYLKRGKTGNKVTWITPYDLYGELEDFRWLKIKDTPSTPIKDKNQSENYENWTKEQLINEIKKVKAEIEALKNNKFLSACSKQIELRKKLTKLEKLEESYNNDNKSTNNFNNNKFPTGWVVGSGVLIIGILTAIIGIKLKSKKRK